MKNSDLEVLEAAIDWLEQGHQVDLVTLISTWGSAPRPVGSIAVVRGDGTIVGSVSGGCVEKELAGLVQQENSMRLVQHQVSNEQAARFGLPCGGSLKLAFERSPDVDQLRQVVQVLTERKRVARRVDLVSGAAMLDHVDRNQGFQQDEQSFSKVFGPSWRLVLIGAGQLSRYVAEMGLALDYEVIVCDPRQHFTGSWNVPGTHVDEGNPDEVVRSLSGDSHSAVLALTHDPNLDDLALVEALSSEVFYVGALGSRKNNAKRRQRLVNAFGLDPAQLERLHGPIGLNIGSRTPAEIAVSILAEVTTVRYQIDASEST